MGGPGGGMGGPGGGGGGGGFQMPPVKVAFETAMPIAEAKERLEQKDPYKELREKYIVVSVSGLRMMGGGRRQGAAGGEGGAGNREPMDSERMKEMQAQMTARLKENTTLNIKDAAYQPEEVKFVQTPNGSVALLAFLRSDVKVGPGDKQMQLKMKMGPMEIVAKFSPKDMMYGDKFTL